MKTFRARTFALILVSAFLLSCSDGFPPEFPAADFSLKSPLTGKAINFSEVKGKPVIIYWFTSW